MYSGSTRSTQYAQEGVYSAQKCVYQTIGTCWTALSRTRMAISRSKHMQCTTQLFSASILLHADPQCYHTTFTPTTKNGQKWMSEAQIQCWRPETSIDTPISIDHRKEHINTRLKQSTHITQYARGLRDRGPKKCVEIGHFSVSSRWRSEF